MQRSWKSYIEIFLITLSILAMLLLFFDIPYADKIVVVPFSALALYYLLSGALVLFNKKIVHGMRLIYFVGLWSITVGLIGFVYKLKFWFNSDLLLLFAAFLAMAVMAFMIIYFRTSGKDSKDSLKYQLQPIFLRLLIYPAIFFIFSTVPHGFLYGVFGEYRENETHMLLYLDVLEDPQNNDKREALQQYEQNLKSSDDNTTGAADN